MTLRAKNKLSKLYNIWPKHRVSKGGTKYFCIGFNKTGTTSLQRAFEEFGFPVGDQRTAELLADQHYFDGDFAPIIDYCDSAQVFQDVPFSWPNTYKYLDQAFPGSKYILTIRDDAEQWYRSITRFHGKLFGKDGATPTSQVLKEATYAKKGWMYNLVRVYGTSDEAPYKKDILIEHYNRHNDAVVEYFKDRPDDLLIINLGESDSFQRFCEFIDVEPNGRSKFPWENKTSEIDANHRLSRLLGIQQIMTRFNLEYSFKNLFLAKIKHVLRVIVSPKQSYCSYKLRKMMKSGRVAIVPCGFRCFTKERLYPKLGISQASLPFDVGFFPPSAVGETIRNQRVDLKINDPATQTACIKSEEYNDSKFGFGIKFETVTYDEINHLVKDRNQKDINKYLDDTFGYYTLDVKNGYVLAHYNWHEFANVKNSNGCTEPAYNLIKINELMNRRIHRLVNLCEKAEIIIFIYDETQGYEFMAIDDVYFNLHDLEPIKKALKSKFSAKLMVMKSEDIKTPHDMLSMINNCL